MVDFSKQIQVYQKSVETALDFWLPKPDLDPKNLHEAMRYSVLAEGKRIRPILLYATGQAFDVELNNLNGPACAVEIIHAYSLIHDDLPCMDNDLIRRGKPSTHIKFGESTAVLAGNSLLTMAFEILSHKDLNVNEKTKIRLINKISESSGHLGIAGGQYLDLSYEHKKISEKKIIEMEIKKTGKLFSFCCVAPLILKNKSKKDIQKFENIGADIGLLFQVADDLIDYNGNLLAAGKKTGKDKKKGKATLINLLGYKNTIKYANDLIIKINSKIKKYGTKSQNLSHTLNYILNRNK